MGSILYDSTGRRKEALVEIDWTEITGIPARVTELAALGDPGGLRYVGWDDSANELAFFAFDAADIPYDNGTSGLTATDVQAAIDELAAMIADAGVFFGYVGSDGSTGNVLPAGWSAVRNSVGNYTVTHNVTGLVPVVTMASGVVADVMAVTIGANSFTVHINLSTDVTQLRDRNFTFAGKIPG